MKKSTKLLLVVVAILSSISLCGVVAMAQVLSASNRTGNNFQIITEEIKGKVTSVSGEPLPGASVFLKSSPTTGTVTDADGNFKLNVPKAEGVLVISYIGYDARNIEIGNRKEINVSLNPDQKNLDEIVVIGYGNESKKKLTTAISKVSSKDISQQPVGSPGDALAGLAAGVQVQSTRGDTPGEAPQIRIRGIGSIGGGADVLYVVDGYPLQDASNFNQINPSDIESMEILKDAASAAIYGSRASNGVIIVTTKRGKAGKTRFDFSTYTGFQSILRKYEVMNKDEYVTYAKRAANITAEARGVAPIYPNILDSPEKLSDTDWQDVIYRTGRMTDYQLSATGGTDRTRFLISGGYFKQEGILKGTDFERITLRFNLDADLSSKLKIGISLAPSFSKQLRIPATGQFNNSTDGNIGRQLPNVINSALIMPPIINVFDADGDYGQPNSDPAYSQFGYFPQNLFNPLSTIEQVTNRFGNFRNLGNSYLEWSPLSSLKLKSSIGATLDIQDQSGYIPATTSTDASGNINSPNLSSIWAVERNRRSVDWVWENTVNYSLSLGKEDKHHLSFLGLYSLQRFSSKLVSSNGKIGTYTNQTVRNPSASSDIQGSVGFDENAFVSFAGRINYDFMGRYLFTAAIRQDGSSKFGPNNRFSSFPSVSAAWRVIDESFMEGTKNVVSDLKVRASYGETGNANIGSFTWANSVTASNYTFNGVRNLGAIESGLPNPDLTWEKNKQYDIGLEIGFLNNKVNINADYYVKNTQDMLLNKNILGITGYATTYRANLGSLRNEGFELSINTNLNIGKVGWSADYNFSTNRNEITDLGGPTGLPGQEAVFGWNNVFALELGKPIGNMNGFIVEGVFKTQEDLAQYAKVITGNRIGDWRIKDVNGDGKIDENDRTVLGNGIPRFTYATTQRFNFKGFELSFLIQGVADVSIINGNYRQVGASSGTINTLKDVVNNFFDPAVPNRDVRYHAIGASGFTMTNQLTDRVVFDAAYIRLRNVNLAYNVPSNLLKKVKINALRVYVSGQNLFISTKYPGGNPESSIIGDVFRPGVDQGAYPSARTITMGLNVGF
jgi:TonB-linked SusC/RagA family outer membrane protein